MAFLALGVEKWESHREMGIALIFNHFYTQKCGLDESIPREMGPGPILKTITSIFLSEDESFPQRIFRVNKKFVASGDVS